MYYDNVNEEAAHLRDVYLSAEKDYVKFLMQFEEVKELIVGLNHNYSSSYLFELAQGLIKKVEVGEFSEEEMEKVERKLIFLLAAIQDKMLIKELIKTPDYEKEQELSNGRSR